MLFPDKLNTSFSEVIIVVRKNGVRLDIDNISAYPASISATWNNLPLMARLPRYALPGQAQHVIQRGNNRCAIFVTDDDYRFYLECLSDAAKKTGCDIHAYVQMTNHVHLLVTPQHKESIAKMLQSVGRRYVQYFNQAYKRTGTLWEGRYKATLIDSEAYLLTCYRYIELNPVRAGMVLQPAEYAWSSYRCHAEGAENSLITDHPLYLALGATTEARQSAYRELLGSDLSTTELDSIREATNKAWVLGSHRFKEEISVLTDRRVMALSKGRPRKPNKIESDPHDTSTSPHYRNCKTNSA